MDGSWITPFPHNFVLKYETNVYMLTHFNASSPLFQTLLNPEVLAHNAGMAQIVCNFLEPGVYNRGKGQLARRVSLNMRPFISKATFRGPKIKNKIFA